MFRFQKTINRIVIVQYVQQEIDPIFFFSNHLVPLLEHGHPSGAHVRLIVHEHPDVAVPLHPAGSLVEESPAEFAVQRGAADVGEVQGGGQE